MVNKIINIINEKYPLTALDVKEFAKVKAKGMTFTIKAYNAQGLGHISIMSAKGFFGLMKMDTIIINPKDIDLPLYSYDRIYAMNNDILITELYNTLSEKLDLSILDNTISKYSNLQDRDPGKHWYDDIKLKQSISKKSKKKDSTSFDNLTIEYLTNYLSLPANKTNDLDKKVLLTKNYVNGLLENGGPSTDVFLKKLGKEKTELLFNNILFGITK